MPHYCQNDPCESEAVEVVPVSVDADTIEFRRYCHTCSEAYNVGCQHGHFRSVRQLRAHADSLNGQGFVIEAGVIFAALPKLDTCTDPGEEGLEPPPLEDGENGELDDDEDEVGHCEGDDRW